jgi:hypothetical protein
MKYKLKKHQFLSCSNCYEIDNHPIFGSVIWVDTRMFFIAFGIRVGIFPIIGINNEI